MCIAHILVGDSAACATYGLVIEVLWDLLGKLLLDLEQLLDLAGIGGLGGICCRA